MQQKNKTRGRRRTEIRKGDYLATPGPAGYLARATIGCGTGAGTLFRTGENKVGVNSHTSPRSPIPWRQGVMQKGNTPAFSRCCKAARVVLFQLYERKLESDRSFLHFFRIPAPGAMKEGSNAKTGKTEQIGKELVLPIFPLVFPASLNCLSCSQSIAVGPLSLLIPPLFREDTRIPTGPVG